ncbi:MAG: winged helix-turn-helix transcriptional regulator [archaeon]
MKTTQEISVWYVLPSLRRELALVLKKKNIPQKEIAQILGITGPAVSQYIKNKRAKEIVFSKSIKKEIIAAANSIASKKSCHRFAVESLLETIKKSGFLCEIHRKYDDVPKCCNVCMKGEKYECLS